MKQGILEASKQKIIVVVLLFVMSLCILSFFFSLKSLRILNYQYCSGCSHIFHHNCLFFQLLPTEILLKYNLIEEMHSE